ncbi:MAG: hypothetical protein A3H71_02290 [Candidatus Sungbacteria bacterium RIFCSPLOWO2_02_FULL_48_13b]|uniref:Uncharacterized protein n=2 Tax=Candidatus Sungiibacteriota TaxID=1817917 RepID=A0A1G2LDY0_9BACT|nr:MAG: hypothetical protein A3C12_03175 [Candidatus Sungbacteria bacterium RIFCSPHIGHO2_02_FULL_49_20]OHA09845.1 MAG: hypothetical protein A3H71_02290 [Candidatus Sungbacteria bacterium RIFCSPLOWO2_02_FULL_48_13b]
MSFLNASLAKIWAGKGFVTGLSSLDGSTIQTKPFTMTTFLFPESHHDWQVRENKSGISQKFSYIRASDRNENNAAPYG